MDNWFVYKIFLSSPSDVKEERNVVEKAVNLINSGIANTFGINFKISRYEDLPPSTCEPQKAINPEIINSDHLIVILWQKWGTRTSKYTSGTEEEFCIAKENKKKIWLYFKELSIDKQDNPDKDIKRIIAFKKIIQKEFLYCEFKDENAFREKIEKDLLILLGKDLAAYIKIPVKINEIQIDNQTLVPAFYFNKETQETYKIIDSLYSKGKIAEIINIYSKIDKPDPSITEYFAKILASSGALFTAKEKFQELLKLAKSLNDENKYYGTLIHLGDIESKLGNLKEALTIFNQIDFYLSNKTNTKLLASVKLRLGDVYQKQMILDKALSYTSEALILFEEVIDKDGIPISKQNLGVIYRLLKDFSKAKSKSFEAFKINKNNKNPENMLMCLANIGDIYLDQNELTKAMKYYHYLIIRFKKYNYLKNLEALCYQKIGVIFLT